MTLHLKDVETDAMARQLAELTGKSPEEAVKQALREQLAQLRPIARGDGMAERLMELGRRCAALPVQDTRSADEIIGYDENGLPR